MRLIVITILTCFLSACGSDYSGPNLYTNTISFDVVDSEQSGINFFNTITEDTELNYFSFEYIFNGGGVAIGDVNNDGLEDIFLTSNQGENKLYLNTGKLTFEDITAQALPSVTPGWNTGANMIDVNNDGLLDIYVCRSGWKKSSDASRQNLLFVNRGNNKFVEMAEQFGLNESGHSINSSFFDYDNDGDLDCYITNHPINKLDFDETYKTRDNPPTNARDKLYENNKGVFTDVSLEAGIINYTYGLGLVTADLNKDGWVDIYGTSDFTFPDFYYINNGDGTFTDAVLDDFGHISFFAMGVDAADINNDGYEDIFVTEMLPTDYERSKTNMASMNVKQHTLMQKMGLHSQYMHNTLQISRKGQYFSETANYAGVAKSDWSWGCLMEDFDNDGLRDIYVSNGWKRDYVNQDFKTYLKNTLLKQQNHLDEINKSVPAYIPQNFIFKNVGGSKFEVAKESMDKLPSTNSQGIAVADLDNDGDLDIVMNNLDEIALVLENTSPKSNYINLKLEALVPGREMNAKVTIYTTEGRQYHEVKNSRGYQSSSSKIVHFGLGAEDKVQKVEVKWLNGSTSTLLSPPTNTTVQVYQKDATKAEGQEAAKPSIEFTEVEALSPPYTSTELEYDDYAKQILLPHRYSRRGPFMSKGDINGDGLMDVYIGGSAGRNGETYVNTGNGQFEKTTNSAFQEDRYCEDMNSTFVDADQDGDLDLYVVSGGVESEVGSKYYVDRLYLNDGSGTFTKATALAPSTAATGTAVVAADFNGDGLTDFFVGGGILPDNYPLADRSLLYLQTEEGLTEVGQAWGLDNIGAVSDAVGTDYDGDGDVDLIAVGEWTGINVLTNTGKEFSREGPNAKLAEKTKGWWKTIETVDIDSDGDMDFLVGNKGLNSKYTVSADKPLQVYADDFDNSGTFDVFLAKGYKDRTVPVRGRECSSQQMPVISQQFETFESFAKADISDIIKIDDEEVVAYEANTFASMLVMNNEGSLTTSELPDVVQWSEVNSLEPYDFNMDGLVDILVGGNNYDTEAETSRADASIGTILLNKGDGKLVAATDEESNILLNGNVKDVTIIDNILLVAANREQLRAYSINVK